MKRIIPISLTVLLVIALMMFTANAAVGTLKTAADEPTEDSLPVIIIDVPGGPIENLDDFDNTEPVTSPSTEPVTQPVSEPSSSSDTQAPTEVVGILGDADESGEVAILDATAIQRHIALLTTLSEKGQLLGDVDGNDDLTIMDATYLQRFLAKMDVEYPIESVIYR